MKKLALFLSIVSASAFGQYDSSYITIFNFKSPYGVDWTSPSSLAVSTLKNSIAYSLGITSNKRKIGHSAVKIACRGQEEIYTGMGSVDSRGETLNLLLKDSAMGVLLHRFKGEMDDPAELARETASGRKSGDINSITYLIEDRRCQELIEHRNEWIERKAFLNYGLLEDPLKYTGAGCSAYAVSFLRLNGIAPEEHKKNWRRSALIPREHIGPYNRLRYVHSAQALHPVQATDQGTNLVQLILSANKWADSDEDAVKLEFWSPDMMYQWTKGHSKKVLRKVAEKKMEKPWKVEKLHKSVNVIFDARSTQR